MKILSTQRISKDIFKEYEAHFIRELWNGLYDIEKFPEILKERDIFTENEYNLDKDWFFEESDYKNISIEFMMYSRKEFISILRSVSKIKEYNISLYHELIQKLKNDER